MPTQELVGTNARTGRHWSRTRLHRCWLLHRLHGLRLRTSLWTTSTSVTVTASPASSPLPSSSSSPLHCSHFCLRRTRFLVAHIWRALLFAFSPTLSGCDSSEGARLFCFSRYCQRSFLNRRDRGVRQHDHDGAGFVQPQQIRTLWRHHSGSVPASSIVSERALVPECVSSLVGRLRPAALVRKELYDVLLEGMLEFDLEEQISGQNWHRRSLPPCVRHRHCTLEFGRSKSVLHIRWTVIQQRGSHWVRAKNKEVAFGNQWNRFSREIIARAGSAPTFLCCILDPHVPWVVSTVL